jgi:hypothetical protein
MNGPMIASRGRVGAKSDVVVMHRTLDVLQGMPFDVDPEVLADLRSC